MSESNLTEYRPIPNYPGYRVGSDGSVWTCKKRGTAAIWHRSDTWTKLRPKVERSGYLRLTLRTDGQPATLSVHQLVLAAFKGPCPEGLQSRHLDGNKLNCRLDNLAYGTVQENHDDKQRHGTTARGERDGSSKLTADQVREMRRRMSNGESPKLVGPAFGVSDVLAYAIRKRRLWQHI